jgi:hypothetical protein
MMGNKMENQILSVFNSSKPIFPASHYFYPVKLLPISLGPIFQIRAKPQSSIFVTSIKTAEKKARLGMVEC